MLPVFDEQLARHLGLDALRTGVRLGGSPVGARIVLWWVVNIGPSFAPHFAVGALHEETWTDGPGLGPVAVSGFVADAAGAAVARLTTDEGLEALGRLNPFQIAPPYRSRSLSLSRSGEVASEIWCEMATLDGLEYSVRWETKATEGRFRFSNPTHEWLIEFERALHRFARRVIALSGQDRFAEQLATWAGYREPLRAERGETG